MHLHDGHFVRIPHGPVWRWRPSGTRTVCHAPHFKIDRKRPLARLAKPASTKIISPSFMGVSSQKLHFNSKTVIHSISSFMIIVKGMLLFEFGNWMISKPNIKIFLQSKRQFTFYWCQLFFIIFTVFNGFVRKNYWNINRHYSTLLWSYLTLIGFSRWILKRSDLNFRWLFWGGLISSYSV